MDNEPLSISVPLPRVKVEVWLNPEQKVGHNKYRVTISGEERLVTQPHVVWFCYTPSGAVNSLCWDEVMKFIITHERDTFRQLQHG